VAILIVYVDDISITWNDLAEIFSLKKYHAHKCEVKDLGQLRYFLGIEISRGYKLK
jgi:hypothetical protein